MADPVIEDVPEDTWTKVATNVTTGIIHALLSEARYEHTYRDTGGAAPSTFEEGAPFVKRLVISATAGIDVYINCQDKDGKVRVDL